MISQLTVFLANEKGRLAAACRTLADADINMKEMCIRDSLNGCGRRLAHDERLHGLRGAEQLESAGGTHGVVR